MKNILKVFIITAGLVLCFNAKSFALVDVAAWGGYVFNGDVAGLDFNGGQYGLKAHYNTSFVALFDIGFGAYYQYSKLKFDFSGADKFTRKSAGLDVNLILSMIPIVHPYARCTWAFMDKIEDDNKKFKAYGAGIGAEIKFLPFICLFGEYMYEKSKHDDAKFTLNAVNFGLKADI